MTCTGLFDHSIANLKTEKIDRDFIVKVCTKCPHKEVLPRSSKNLIFVNSLVLQKKKWAAEDNKKELLQPINVDGSVNEEFTKAYGFNPFDETTKSLTPAPQGGTAKV